MDFSGTSCPAPQARSRSYVKANHDRFELFSSTLVETIPVVRCDVHSRRPLSVVSQNLVELILSELILSELILSELLLCRNDLIQQGCITIVVSGQGW